MVQETPASAKIKEFVAFGAKVTASDDLIVETGVIAMTTPETHYGL
jgi:hypothetical protein